MAKVDYYELLGVSKTATDAELKSAFRKLAMKHHPDKNPGDHARPRSKFKELNEAYQVLSDGQKRAAYDRFGHAAFENGGGGPGFGNDFASFDGRYLRGPVRRFRRPAAAAAAANGRERGSDLRYNLEITLEEAYHGQDGDAHGADRPSPARPARAAAPSPAPSRAMRDLRRARPRARQPGLLLDRADLPHLPGPGPDHRRSLPRLQRRRPRHARAYALGEHPGGRRGRHAHPAGQRGRGGAARRAGWRSLHLPVHQAARLPAAGRRGPVLPRAGLAGHGRARRRGRRSRHRRRRAPR